VREGRQSEVPDFDSRICEGEGKEMDRRERGGGGVWGGLRGGKKKRGRAARCTERGRCVVFDKRNLGKGKSEIG